MINNTSLSYNDETDRAYGVAGMTIAMAQCDGEAYLASVNIDNPVGAAIVFTPAFGFSGNPRLIASLAWREHLNQFQLLSAMIMGNVLCRSNIRAAMPLSDDKIKALRELIAAEGRERCSLDDDELDIIFTKTQRALSRTFTHPAVSRLAHNLVDSLQRRRSLSAVEVFEILGPLYHM